MSDYIDMVQSMQYSKKFQVFNPMLMLQATPYSPI